VTEIPLRFCSFHLWRECGVPIDAPCPLFASHGDSLRRPRGAGAVRSRAPGIDEMVREKRAQDAEALAARQRQMAARRSRGPLSAAQRAERLAAMQGCAPAPADCRWTSTR
jgi:hypothetical protein